MIVVDIVDVVCALIEHNGKVLVAQRAAGKSLAGKWEFPGGKIDRNETAFQAIVREIREELDCEVEPLSSLRPIVHEYPETTIVLHPIVCELRHGEPRPLEHDAIQWVEALAARSLDLAEADIAVLEDFLRIANPD